MKKRPLFIGFLALIVLVGIIFAERNDNTNQNALNDGQTPLSNPSDENLGLVYVPDGWKMYTDGSIRFNYPETMTVEKNGQYSVLINPPENPVGNAVPTFMYVSVIPSSETNDEGNIYNYYRPDFERLSGLDVNESTTLTENRELDEWYKFTRLPDRQISGITAKQYVNLKPWEFQLGTQETRYIFEKDATKYLIGAYYQPGNPRLTKETISDIIDSFSILSGQEILE